MCTNVRKERAAGTVRGVLIIAGHYFVDAAQRDAYVEAFRDLVQRARAAPGCLDVAITADAVDPGRVNNYERWESEDALAAFRAVADPPELDVEMLDMQMSKFHIDRESDPFD
jgi:quinol monooxygenase YgiN